VIEVVCTAVSCGDFCRERADAIVSEMGVFFFFVGICLTITCERLGAVAFAKKTSKFVGKSLYYYDIVYAQTCINHVM